ncbi:MAG TPA: peptidase M16, partial [Methylophaga sp.]|nr:peptidase M16 [Methylophaga sp.]
VATVKPQVEIPQRGKRTLELKAPAELPYLMMGWKVPVVTTAIEDWEPYALDVLAGILDGGASSRFSRELIRGQQVAAGVSAYNSAFSRLDDIFTIAATPAQGKTIEEVKQAVFAQLDKVKTEPVTEAELQRVKTQVIASSVYQLDSVFYQAMQLGMLETVGLDWRLADSYPDKISEITAEQVQQVAEKYFIEDGLTIAELIPLPSDNATPRPTSGDPHAR